MSGSSTIEWTDATWNPVRGCEWASPGCDHCYAKTFAERWIGVPGHAYEQGFALRLVPELLDAPARWSRPRTVFANSMSDFFQKGVPPAYAEACFEVMRLANWHTYQVLTKRAARMREQVSRMHERLQAMPHVWLGVSVEDRKHGLPRIEQLRQTPAAVRFLSVEPLLEDIGCVDLRGIDWVIVGGESGPGARPMARDWVLSIQAQCESANAKFFFKQWGGLHKKLAGRLLDGRVFDGAPARTVAEVPAAKERSRIVREIGDIAARWMPTKATEVVNIRVPIAQGSHRMQQIVDKLADHPGDRERRIALEVALEHALEQGSGLALEQGSGQLELFTRGRG